VEDPKRLVGHAYTLGFDLGNGRTIQVAGNFYVDDPEEVMNNKLDGIMRVLERQRAKCELPLLEAELVTRKRQLRDVKESLVRLETSASARLERGAKFIPQQDTAAIEQQKLNALKLAEAVEEGERNLEEARKRAA
jgi:hypothetical protein